MKCEVCEAVFSYFDGEEIIHACKCDVSEDDAYNANTDTYGCRLSVKTINKKIEEFDKR